jgi:hypothetical protein
MELANVNAHVSVAIASVKPIAAKCSARGLANIDHAYPVPIITFITHAANRIVHLFFVRF